MGKAKTGSRKQRKEKKNRMKKVRAVPASDACRRLRLSCLSCRACPDPTRHSPAGAGYQEVEVELGRWCRRERRALRMLRGARGAALVCGSRHALVAGTAALVPCVAEQRWQSWPFRAEVARARRAAAIAPIDDDLPKREDARVRCRGTDATRRKNMKLHFRHTQLHIQP